MKYNQLCDPRRCPASCFLVGVFLSLGRLFFKTQRDLFRLPTFFYTTLSSGIFHHILGSLAFLNSELHVLMLGGLRSLEQNIKDLYWLTATRVSVSSHWSCCSGPMSALYMTSGAQRSGRGLFSAQHPGSKEKQGRARSQHLQDHTPSDTTSSP